MKDQLVLLNKALANMQVAEGTLAMEALLYEANKVVADKDIKFIAKKLEKTFPKMGDKIAFEVLGKIGILLLDEEGL